jgi:glycosyltransferase involved in cell wall biosynthesis
MSRLQPDDTAARAGSGQLRVLIIGINYFPEHAGIAPYTTGLAEHLAAVGHDVTVLTGMPHYPEWRVHDAYAGRLSVSESIEGVKVRRHLVYVPSRQSALRRACYEASFLATSVLSRGMARPDAILGVVPSLSGAGLARILAARFRTRYGLLFQDVVSQAAVQSGFPEGGRVAKAVRPAERWAITRAVAVGAVTPAFFEALSELGAPAERLWHTPNWTHVKEPRRDEAARVATRTRLGWDPATAVILHAGTIGLKQNLMQVVQAAARAAGGHGARSQFRFVLMGHGSEEPAIRAAISSLGLSNVTLIPPEPSATFMDVLVAADVLLVTERASVRDMSLPSKLTSYALSGRPVVAAVRPDGATADEVRSSGNGIVVPPEDVEALLGTLQRVLADPDSRRRMGAKGVSRALLDLAPHRSLAKQEEMIRVIAGAAAPFGRDTAAPARRKSVATDRPIV